MNFTVFLKILYLLFMDQLSLYISNSLMGKLCEFNINNIEYINIILDYVELEKDPTKSKFALLLLKKITLMNSDNEYIKKIINDEFMLKIYRLIVNDFSKNIVISFVIEFIGVVMSKGICSCDIFVDYMISCLKSERIDDFNIFVLHFNLFAKSLPESDIKEITDIIIQKFSENLLKYEGEYIIKLLSTFNSLTFADSRLLNDIFRYFVVFLFNKSLLNFQLYIEELHRFMKKNTISVENKNTLCQMILQFFDDESKDIDEKVLLSSLLLICNDECLNSKMIYVLLSLANSSVDFEADFLNQSGLIVCVKSISKAFGCNCLDNIKTLKEILDAIDQWNMNLLIFGYILYCSHEILYKSLNIMFGTVINRIIEMLKSEILLSKETALSVLEILCDNFDERVEEHKLRIISTLSESLNELTRMYESVKEKNILKCLLSVLSKISSIHEVDDIIIESYLSILFSCYKFFNSNNIRCYTIDILRNLTLSVKRTDKYCLQKHTDELLSICVNNIVGDVSGDLYDNLKQESLLLYGEFVRVSKDFNVLNVIDISYIASLINSNYSLQALQCLCSITQSFFIDLGSTWFTLKDYLKDYDEYSLAIVKLLNNICLVSESVNFVKDLFNTYLNDLVFLMCESSSLILPIVEYLITCTQILEIHIPVYALKAIFKYENSDVEMVFKVMGNMVSRNCTYDNSFDKMLYERGIWIVFDSNTSISTKEEILLYFYNLVHHKSKEFPYKEYIQAIFQHDNSLDTSLMFPVLAVVSGIYKISHSSSGYNNIVLKNYLMKYVPFIDGELLPHHLVGVKYASDFNDLDDKDIEMILDHVSKFISSGFQGQVYYYETIGAFISLLLSIFVHYDIPRVVDNFLDFILNYFMKTLTRSFSNDSIWNIYKLLDVNKVSSQFIHRFINLFVSILLLKEEKIKKLDISSEVMYKITEYMKIAMNDENNSKCISDMLKSDAQLNRFMSILK